MKTQTKASFPKFEQNQILSSTHLNQLRQYLDEGNRLTRVRLTGVGIVCGLKLTYNASSNKNIGLSAGYGITTEGYLLEMDAKLFTHYRATPYYDPADPYYEFGKEADTDDGYNDALQQEVSYPEPEGDETPKAGAPVLYELLESSDPDTTKLALSTFPGLDNHVVVLYYEFIDDELKKCTGSNCDNKGVSRIMTVRALLAKKSDLLTYDRESLLASPNELPELNIPRLSNNDLVKVESNSDLQKLYANKVYPNSFIKLLADAIDDAYNTYHIRLGLPSKHLSAAKATLGTLSTGVIYYQYVADVMKDVVVTYNEFAEAAYAFSDKCGATISTFPRHLTAGALIPDGAYPYDQYRTDFFDALPPDRSDKNLLKAQLLYKKLLQLILCFKVPASSNIDITPGKYVPLKLSDWCVPFYYDPARLVQFDAQGKGNLLKYWNPTQTLRGKRRERTAYYSGVYSKDKIFTKPFGFSIEHLPFLRVEGIQGKDRDQAISTLEQLKQRYNLGFDIVAVRIDDVGELPGYSDCMYKDLQEEYVFHRRKLLDFLKTILDYMKTALPYLDETSATVLEKTIAFLQTRYDDLVGVFDECLEHFDYIAFKLHYKKYINYLVELILASGLLKAASKALPGTDPSGVKSVDSLASLLLSLGSRIVYQLIDSMYYNKLYRIYYNYTIRAGRHKLQTKFSTFAQLHPGMDHLGGLRNHETLVLVYAPGAPTNPDAPEDKGVEYIEDDDTQLEENKEELDAERLAKEKEAAKELARKKKEITNYIETLGAAGDEESAKKLEELMLQLKKG